MNVLDSFNDVLKEDSVFRHIAVDCCFGAVSGAQAIKKKKLLIQKRDELFTRICSCSCGFCDCYALASVAFCGCRASRC